MANSINILDEINELLDTSYGSLDEIPREVLLQALTALFIAIKLQEDMYG